MYAERTSRTRIARAQCAPLFLSPGRTLSSANALIGIGMLCALADIDNLINMVPAKFYFPPDPDEQARKYQKFTGKVPKAPKHERKMAAAERKRARLDPNQPGVLDQIGAEGDEEEDDEPEEASDEDDDDEDDDDEEEEEEEEQPKKGAASKPSQQQRAPKPPVDMAALAARERPTLDASGRLEGATTSANGPVLSADGLKKRLAERLAEMRGSRGGSSKTAGERAAQKEKSKSKPPKRPSGVTNGGSGAAASSTAGIAGTPAPANGAGAPVSARGSSSSIEFNKLAAAASQPSKAKRKLSTSALLAQAEESDRRKQARLNAPDGGGEDMQIEEWQRALQKAGGIKQRDNPKLLRKALKRKEASKKKSSREWASRLKTVAKTMADKQEKRKSNLADRKTKNKSKAAKNKQRAGFEGKKSSFL